MQIETAQHYVLKTTVAKFFSHNLKIKYLFTYKKYIEWLKFGLENWNKNYTYLSVVGVFLHVRLVA